MITAFNVWSGVIAWTWTGSNSGSSTPVRDHVIAFQADEATNLHGINTLNGSQIWEVSSPPLWSVPAGGPLFYISSIYTTTAYFPTNGSTAFVANSGTVQPITLKPSPGCEASNAPRDAFIYFNGSYFPVIVDALTGVQFWAADRNFSYSQYFGAQYSFSSTSVILWTQNHYVSINIQLDEIHNCAPYIEWIIAQDFFLMAQPTSAWIFGWPQGSGSNFTVYDPQTAEEVFSIPMQPQTNNVGAPKFIATDTRLIVTSTSLDGSSTKAFQLPEPYR